jgi:hypothetical protein
MNDAERDQILAAWSKPPSDTEDERADNACRVITNAIKSSPDLAKWDIDVFIQGSYKNNTNVRLYSDVDICVRLNSIFTTDYKFAPGSSDASEGIERATYTYAQFKSDLLKTLITAFGKSNVKRGNKAFNIAENTFRVTADVVPCIQHRRYEGPGIYTAGTSLWADNGTTWIHNFPEQHHANGILKNKATNGFFKDTVRVMKNLRNKMNEQGIVSAKPVASFFNECLVWNTPNATLTLPTWSETIRETLIHLWNNLDSDEKCGEWGQVSELLYLFRSNYSRTQARDWVNAAWIWLEFK